MPSKTPVVLALDLGTQTGWAIGTAEALLSGSESFKPTRFESAGMRYVKFERFLNQLADTFTISIVAIEEVRRHAGTDAAHVYGGLLAHLQRWCDLRVIPYTGHPVGTIKKHAAGKGNASKDEMISAMRRAGHDPKDDNEADALAIWHLQSETMIH